MAHEKNHDYHILKPSPWPLVGAASAFIMFFGAVLYMNDSGPWMMLIGFAGVLYTMYAWWAEVVHEGNTGDHTPVVKIGLRYGVILFITSEVMFFVAWFWAFFRASLFPLDDYAGGVWPPVGIETLDAWHLPLINTLILLCSGAAATWAHHALAHENDRKGWCRGLSLLFCSARCSHSSKVMSTHMRRSALAAMSTAVRSSWRLVSTDSTLSWARSS